MAQQHVERAQVLLDAGDAERALAVIEDDWAERALWSDAFRDRYDEVFHDAALATHEAHLEAGNLEKARTVRETYLSRYADTQDHAFAIAALRARQDQLLSLDDDNDPRAGLAADDALAETEALWTTRRETAPLLERQEDEPGFAELFDTVYATAVSLALPGLLAETNNDAERLLSEYAQRVRTVPPASGTAGYAPELVSSTLAELADHAIEACDVDRGWRIVGLLHTFVRGLTPPTVESPTVATESSSSAYKERHEAPLRRLIQWLGELTPNKVERLAMIDRSRIAEIEARGCLPVAWGLEDEAAARPLARSVYVDHLQEVRNCARRLETRQLGVRVEAEIGESWLLTRVDREEPPPLVTPIVDAFVMELLAASGYGEDDDGPLRLVVRLAEQVHGTSPPLGDDDGNVILARGTALNMSVAFEWVSSAEVDPEADPFDHFAMRGYFDQHPDVWQANVFAASDVSRMPLLELEQPARDAYETALWRDAARRLAAGLARLRLPTPATILPIQGDDDGGSPTLPPTFAEPLVLRAPRIYLVEASRYSRASPAPVELLGDDGRGEPLAIGDHVIDDDGRRFTLEAIGPAGVLRFLDESGDPVWVDRWLLEALPLWQPGW